eukprot:864826-Rhodomonas_salina.1
MAGRCQARHRQLPVGEMLRAEATFKLVGSRSSSCKPGSEMDASLGSRFERLGCKDLEVRIEGRGSLRESGLGSGGLGSESRVEDLVLRI